MIKKIKKQKNKKIFSYFLIFLFSSFLLATAAPVLADDGCSMGGTVGSSEAGVFMQGICEVCWELGECQLEDFMQVFVNVSTYILSIVGSLALLVFVIGGFYWMISQGDSNRVTKGKDFMKGGVIGLLIVFGAYVGISSVVSIVVEGRFAGIEGYQICGEDNDGASCGKNQQCYLGQCKTICYASSAGANMCVSDDQIADMNDPLTCSTGTGVCLNEDDSQCCVIYTETGGDDDDYYDINSL